MLREKGGAKVYIIVIVVLVALCAAVGIFAVVNMNKDKEDDEKTSKKNETNTSKSADEDEEDDKKENKDKDEEDDDKDGLVKYSGTLDMTSLMGTDELKDTVWTISVEGNEDMLSKLSIKAELEKYLQDSYDTAGGSNTGYTYDEFLKEIHKTLDSSMGTMGTQFTTGLGVSKEDVTTKVDWVDDETMEIEVDLSKIAKSEYDVEDDESLIDYVIDSFKKEGVKMKKD